MNTKESFMIVNIDKNQYILPAAFGEFDDKSSILNSKGGILSALAVLLSNGNGQGGGDITTYHPIVGTWAGDRVALLSSDAPIPANASDNSGINLYAQFLKTGADISAEINLAISDDGNTDWVPSRFNHRLGLPTTVQRLVMERWEGSFMRLSHEVFGEIKTIGHLFALMGEDVPWSNQGARMRAERGLSKILPLLLPCSKVSVPVAAITEDSTSVEMHVVVTKPNGRNEKTVINVPINKGFTAQMFYEQLVPGLTWIKK